MTIPATYASTSYLYYYYEFIVLNDLLTPASGKISKI